MFGGLGVEAAFRLKTRNGERKGPIRIQGARTRETNPNATPCSIGALVAFLRGSLDGGWTCFLYGNNEVKQ